MTEHLQRCFVATVASGLSLAADGGDILLRQPGPELSSSEQGVKKLLHRRRSQALRPVAVLLGLSEGRLAG